MVEDYLWRLSNVLDQEFDLPDRSVHSYPPKRDMRLPLSEHAIDLLDFLAMTGCQLQVTTAQKNSGLGRVMMTSQVFLYQWQFLNDSTGCLAYLESEDSELFAKLQKVVAIKRSELDRYAWLAIWAGPEMRHYYGATQQWLSEGERISLAEEDFRLLLQLIEFTQQVKRDPHALSLDVTPFREPLEQALARLGQTNRGGQVLSTLSDLTELLTQGAEMLQRDQGRLCPTGKATAQAQILHTVFLKFYIGQVQPYLAFVHQQTAPWFDQQNQLLKSFGFERPEMFKLFEAKIDPQHPESIWMRYQKAVKDHTLAWQNILGNCGLMPGRD